MSKSISLFSGYSQKENRTTNYCLLILKLLYEENPKYLGEVLGALMGEDIGDRVGVHFRQQERRDKSVPDGLIFQAPFTIYIETKNFDWFYYRQLVDHLDALNAESPGLKILLALGNFETNDINQFESVQKHCASAYHGKVVFTTANFADLLEALRALQLPKNLADTVDDFGAYLDEESLLPNWQTRLDVVNCATFTDESMDNVYLCPATGGAYNHRRSNFFGLYKAKRVSHVAAIRTVIDVNSSTEHRTLWINEDGPEAPLVKLAREKLEKWRPGAFPARVFLLGELHETDFQKDTPGGMLGSKLYFWVKADTAQELATQLTGQKWSEWKQS